MAGCGWRQEAGPFRYLEVDFRHGEAQERTAVLRTAVAEVEAPGGRVPVLVRWESGAFDVAWFKEIKDANRATKDLDLRVAFVGLGSRGPAFAGMLNFRVRQERVRHFDDEEQALAWLEEQM